MATDIQIGVRKVRSVNPATGELLQEFESASAEDVAAAVNRARAVQPVWNGTAVQERVVVLREFQRRLNDKRSKIARTITSEAGKPLVEGLLTEIVVVLDAARFYAENAYAFLREQSIPHGNLAMKTKSGKIVREPHGVIGIISPWNSSYFCWPWCSFFG